MCIMHSLDMGGSLLSIPCDDVERCMLLLAFKEAAPNPGSLVLDEFLELIITLTCR